MLIGSCLVTSDPSLRLRCIFESRFFQANQWWVPPHGLRLLLR